MDSDKGKFHSDNTGVFHFGFDRAFMRTLLIHHGFHNVRDVTAASVVKDLPDGKPLEFAVFLMTARK